MEFEVKQYGDIPRSRFGHSITIVSKNMVVLFGGALGDTGKYDITNECYIFTMNNLVWTKVLPKGNITPRAAHAAVKVDEKQMIVYGGATGGGSLATEELYLLDLTDNEMKYQWIIVPVTGATPKRRYGHTLVYSTPNLVLFGGNNGTTVLNDLWIMNMHTVPFIWTKVDFLTSSIPVERVYHSSDVCNEGPANGMIVIFGGRSADGEPLNDLWGLRQHRNGLWDWVKAPYKNDIIPDSRFQHTSCFVGSKLIIIGGRQNMVGKSLETLIYHTETCFWSTIPSSIRFRHASWRFGTRIYTFGGFDHLSQTHPTTGIRTLDVINVFENEQSSKRNINNISLPINMELNSKNSAKFATPFQNKSVRLSHHVFTQLDGHSNHLSGARKLLLEDLCDEGRKIKNHLTPLKLKHTLAKSQTPDELASYIISILLKPNISAEEVERDFSSVSKFAINKTDIITLIDRCLGIFASEDILVEIRAPTKIFGDLHGQYYDLMTLFGCYKAPINEGYFMDNTAEGDIDSTDYLFIGDFVDRGTHSLEVMVLLLALKLQYPDQIHIVRGNHEDSYINSIYGFKDECRNRLGEDPDHEGSLFEYLPLAALIDNKILCLHGGIGSTIQTIEDIKSIKKPVKVVVIPTTDEEQKVTDILWSDPTENDSEIGIQMNGNRDPDHSAKICRFGPDRVIEFLANNDLDLIIRAHECVMDGFERFAGGRLITVFSATDYCNVHKNAGALLYVRKDLSIVPKLIYPAIRETIYKNQNNWLELNSSRPPTPLRIGKVLNDW